MNDAMANPVVCASGFATATVAAGAGDAVVKSSCGRLCKALVTSVGSGQATIYDSAGAPSGTVIGIIPAGAALGAIFDFGIPASAGIVVANAAGGPALTVSFV